MQRAGTVVYRVSKERHHSTGRAGSISFGGYIGTRERFAWIDVSVGCRLIGLMDKKGSIHGKFGTKQSGNLLRVTVMKPSYGVKA